MSSSDFFLYEQLLKCKEPELEYLRFVEIAALQIVLLLGRLYGFAKDMTGPLKPGVEIIEGAVKNVARPGYERIINCSIGVLKYVDGKVDDSIDRHVPSTIRHFAQMLPFAAQTFHIEMRRVGFLEATAGFGKHVHALFEPKAMELRYKYEPVIEQYAVFTWYRLQRLPLFPKLAQFIVLPIASLLTKMYNDIVKSTNAKGYKLCSYLPLVPTERIINLFTNEPALAFGY